MMVIRDLGGGASRLCLALQDALPVGILTAEFRIEDTFSASGAPQAPEMVRWTFEVVSSLEGDSATAACRSGAPAPAPPNLPGWASLCHEPLGPVFTLGDHDDGPGHVIRMRAWRSRVGLCVSVEPVVAGGPPRSHGCFGETPAPANAIAGFNHSRPAILWGLADPAAVKVEVRLHDGATVEAPTLIAPAELGAALEFYFTTVARIELVDRVRVLDAAGAVIAEQGLFDPPGSPVRSSPPPPPYEDVDFWADPGWEPGDPGLPGGGVGQVFAPDREGGAHRFRIEHAGPGAFEAVIWCQSGTLELAYSSGPDESGSGLVVAEIPPGQVACHWFVVAAGGRYDVRAE
jgi:hypothetical protein